VLCVSYRVEVCLCVVSVPSFNVDGQNITKKKLDIKYRGTIIAHSLKDLKFSYSNGYEGLYLRGYNAM
jgi:hypothetical protein